MRIYLIRHGTTSWNAAHRIQGSTDIDLDDLGKRLASETGRRFREEGVFFDHVYSSPLKRAYETALLISPDTVPVTSELLRELDFGDFEGRISEEMSNDPSCFFRYFRTDPVRYDAGAKEENLNKGFHCYESLSDLIERTSVFVREILDPLVISGKAEKVLISGHGAMNKALMMVLSKTKDLSLFWGKGLQPNCGFNIIDCSFHDDKAAYCPEEDSRVLYDPSILGGFKNLF